MKEDKQYLRDKREELYKRMVELNIDAEQMRSMAKGYRYFPTIKHSLLAFSNVLDKEADDIDEVCIAIENYLKYGKTKVPYIGNI